VEKQEPKTMTPSEHQEKTGELEFITNLQKALGRTSGSFLPDQSVLFGTPPPDLEHRLNLYRDRSRPDREKLLDLFMKQAALVNMKVIPVTTGSLAGSAIRELILKTEPEWGTQKSVIAWQHPLIERLDLKEQLASDNIDLFITPSSPAPGPEERQETRHHLIESYIGITSADFCVAESATLVMRSGPGLTRAVSLVPSVHVAVINMDQIIQSLSELYFRLKFDPREKEQGLTNCMTFISGPSKTADIELVMVHGAHGPRQMIVYVITG
jgi:L-lactate dehydrogenase complex protein LldG